MEQIQLLKAEFDLEAFINTLAAQAKALDRDVIDCLLSKPPASLEDVKAMMDYATKIAAVMFFPWDNCPPDTPYRYSLGLVLTVCGDHVMIHPARYVKTRRSFSAVETTPTLEQSVRDFCYRFVKSSGT